MGRAKTPQKAQEEPNSSEQRRSKKAVISDVILKFEQKLQGEEFKPTVGDLIRLLQFEKELEDEQPKEIKVTWVEPDEKDSASEK